MRRLPDAGVADHVRVGVVGDDEVVRARVDGVDERVGHAGGADISGCEVVGRDLRARDQLAILARPGRLDAAVEEVRDVRVLLGLGDVELAPAGLAHRLGQRARGLGREGDEDGQPLLVLGHRHDEEVVGRGRPAGDVRSKPSKAGPSASAWVSWRARSARKLAMDDRIAGRQRRVDAIDRRSG